MIGLFAFSIELEEGGEDYVLRATGRYVHSMARIRRLAEAAGLREVKLQQGVLRMDKGQPIDGCILVLQKLGNERIEGDKVTAAR